MSWSNILNILSGKTSAPVIVGKKKVAWPEKWQLVPVLDIMKLLELESALNIKLLRQGCEILKIPFVGGGTLFFNKCPTEELELEELKRLLCVQLNSSVEYVIAYSKEPKKHPTSVFYKIVAIRSNDVLEMKKALKLHKLKAFL